MESRPAQAAVLWRPPHCRFGAQCWRPGCLFLHEDSVERRHVCYALFWAERNVEQIVHVPVPQIETADQPGDQARRITADSCQRGRRCPSGDATTGPSGSGCAEDGVQPVDYLGDQACREAADSLHRQGCQPAGSAAATGLSNSDRGKDDGSPAHAVHPQNGGRACDLTDQPGDQACRETASANAATGPSICDNGEDGGSPARAFPGC